MSSKLLESNIKSNIPKIISIRNTVINDLDKLIEHIIFNEHINTENINTENNNTENNDIVSIVMTTHNRTTQTLFTLDTIAASAYKNIQVIIVDDSTKGFISNNNLNKYNFRIDYIKIKLEYKNWINPCIGYNIGFAHVIGKYVIIQNAEVCHVGDIINFINHNCHDGVYHVFDVINTGSYASNDMLYRTFNNNKFCQDGISKIIKNHCGEWYQHTINRPKNYHFLTAMHINDLKKMNNGFDYDFSLGRWYDDDEFIFRIKNILKLQIINIGLFNGDFLMGIHQHHDTVTMNTNKSDYKKSIKLNKLILDKKTTLFNKTNQWPFFYYSDINLII